VDPANVTLSVLPAGGSFGRRLETDDIALAAGIAAAVEGTPVQCVWTREEDMAQDDYRPAALARMRARVEDGRALAATLDLAAPAVIFDQTARLVGLPGAGPDMSIVQAAWDQPYAIPHYRVRGFRAPTMLPVSSWRSVGASQNGFFHETMIDEMAHAAGADPLAFRRAHLRHDPSRGVLDAAAEAAGWGRALPGNRARGVAFVMSFGVPVAEVVEIEGTADGIRVVRVTAAVDVGIALDPRNIEAQVISAVMFGLSAAIQGEITVAGGRVEQSNFHDYDGLRMDRTPGIEVVIRETMPAITGIGEPGLPPVAPALGNAVFALTGERLRSLPFGRHMRFA
jgi:isoquinoline 1-oxidoreductase beta subunit